MAPNFHALNTKYGDVVYLDALGQPMVILGTHETALDLLEKRSSIHSDRNVSVLTLWSGWGWLFTTQHYGPGWRRLRKMFHQHFTPTAILSYREVQEREAHRFALRLIEDPQDFLQHIRFAFASTVLRITYGIELEGIYDEYVNMAEAAMAVFNHALFPGEYLAEKFPSLRFLPSWFPGAKFKRKSKVWVPAVHRLRDVPWERTVAKIRGGTATPSIATSLMKDVPDVKSGEVTEEEVAAKKVTATAYAAGADTTLSTMQSFFLAMASNSDAQRKAQRELDAVVGPQRLPTFEDRESLPYVCALISECLRWRPVAPLGFPHRSTEDDCFRGYFIPKGTVTIANVWAYSRDTRYYPDLEAFSPERFLKDGKPNPDVLDPAAFVFGYGRRICPGRHFADASLFMLTATVLHTLTISAPLDAHGQPVKLEGKMTAGVISYPEPFEADIKSRGSWAEALVRESCSAVNV